MSLCGRYLRPTGRLISSRCKCSLRPQPRAFASPSSAAREDAGDGVSTGGLKSALLGGKEKEKSFDSVPESQTKAPAGSRLQRLKSRKPRDGHLAPGTSAPPIILQQTAQRPIRTRFAPSPTGYLHLGSLRTALFNNLTAKARDGGAFILRIEDTDQSRLVSDAEERLIKDLRWAGLSWDEGPDCGGPHGPYRQSERLDTYKEHVQKLLDQGHAYRCFCTPEQLDAQKTELRDAGKPIAYPGTCRSIGTDESDRRAAAEESHVVRFKGDGVSRPELRDAIYGPFQKKDAEDDFILVKTDGYPTYHFANVVDDHLMGITHVIRGEEWLISTPKHLSLYRAFGWTAPMFAHLGLLVNTDGTKLSKRNDSVDIAKYRTEGILPMPLLTWLANLGSSLKSDTMIPRSLQQLAQSLTFKFTRGGIRLNPAKLDHFQVSYRKEVVLDESKGESLAPAEQEIIRQHIIQPVLDEIRRLTGSGPWDLEWALQGWQGVDKELVPALQNEATTGQYVRYIFESDLGAFSTARAIILRNPYLFWRVPLSIYRAALATGPAPDAEVLAILHDKILNQDAESFTKSTEEGGTERKPWQGMQNPPLFPPGIDGAALHNTLRLVATGSPTGPSRSSAYMLRTLGRDEWLYRLGVVQRLREELREGGPEMRRRWLEESEG